MSTKSPTIKDLLPGDQPLVKRTFTCGELDYLLIKTVFPETGFLGYLPAFTFHLMAEELRKHNIKSYVDRVQKHRWATAASAVSDIRIIDSSSVS